MAVNHELEIEIGPDGEITIKVRGAKGPECLEITKGLENALGIVTERQKTSEFYEEKTGTAEEVRGGSGGGGS